MCHPQAHSAKKLDMTIVGEIKVVKSSSKHQQPEKVLFCNSSYDICSIEGLRFDKYCVDVIRTLYECLVANSVLDCIWILKAKNFIAKGIILNWVLGRIGHVKVPVRMMKYFRLLHIPPSCHIFLTDDALSHSPTSPSLVLAELMIRTSTPTSILGHRWQVCHYSTQVNKDVDINFCNEYKYHEAELLGSISRGFLWFRIHHVIPLQ